MHTGAFFDLRSWFLGLVGASGDAYRRGAPGAWLRFGAAAYWFIRQALHMYHDMDM